MSIDRDLAARVAELARLALDEEELDALAADVSRILDHVRALQGVEGAGDGDGSPDEPGAPGATAGAAPSGPPALSERLDSPAPRVLGDLPDPLAPAALPDGPDPLAHPLASMAPDFRDGFFVVPPPPGVHAEDEAP